MNARLAHVVLAALVAGLPGLALAQQPATPPPAAPVEDHSQHQHGAPPPSAGGSTAEATGEQAALPPSIPPVTEAMRAAAFPDVHHHTTSDNAINYLVLFDQLEWQAGGATGGASWDTTAWVGTDRDRLWFRAEGDRAAGRFEQAQLQLLYGRAVARWWNVVAGVRQDVRAGAPRTAAALGLHGTAPYFLHVEASLYAEPNGRTHLRMETEYELLLTNRLVLQPLAEFEIYGRADRAQRLGRGLSTADAGVRLRYEVRRELAPYVGVVWHRRFFDTADQARAAGRRTSGVALALGLRVWL